MSTAGLSMHTEQDLLLIQAVPFKEQALIFLSMTLHAMRYLDCLKLSVPIAPCVSHAEMPSI